MSVDPVSDSDNVGLKMIGLKMIGLKMMGLGIVVCKKSQVWDQSSVLRNVKLVYKMRSFPSA
jgi:hypothetical protein